MSGYLNKATLIGNLGRDPEVRTTRDGKQVVILNIATGESWRDASGNRVERTEWHRVVIWNEALGKLAEQYLAKGAKVYVEGKLVTSKWTDTAGIERYSTEIHLTPYNATLTFLDSAAGRATGGEARKIAAPHQAAAGGASGEGGGSRDDEIPFAPCRQ